MKKLLFLLTLTAAVSCNTPQELAVMTLNMRYDNPEDGMNNWRFRRERIAGLIRSEAVDLLGTQEVLANQFDDLQVLLPGYRAVGVGREDGARAGEFNAVFFRSDRFELLDSGAFWLSEEPETPGSKGWDGLLAQPEHPGVEQFETVAAEKHGVELARPRPVLPADADRPVTGQQDLQVVELVGEHLLRPSRSTASERISPAIRSRRKRQLFIPSSGLS